jgi:DNA-binding Lrp family transcriptional regulator
MVFDSTSRSDVLILELLQSDSTQSVAQVAERAHLSTSACHRRIKSLEQNGTILGYSARLDPTKLGLGLHAFVEISLISQSREAMTQFEEAVANFGDILECHLMSGGSDYYLRISASDLDHFDDIHRNCLARLPGVSAIKSSFAIRRIKTWGGYPVRRKGER